MTEQITVLVPADLAKKIRLDKFLAEQMPDFSRERIKKLINEGMVELNNTSGTTTNITSPTHKVTAGNEYIITIPPAKSLEIKPQNIPLDIVFEDDHLIVINKDAGISVHPSGRIVENTLVNALLYHCKLASIGGVERPGIVHRLDKGTSGLMVVAKDDKTHQNLCEQFADRTIERFYQAVCYGNPMGKPTKIETQLGRHPKNRKKMAVIEKGGKHAITTYKVLKTFNAEISLIECKLFTGRTHQIRVHLTHIGNSLVADPTYGRKHKLSNEQARNYIETLNHQMLHAKVLGFIHPITGKTMHFEAPLPTDMEKLINILNK